MKVKYLEYTSTNRTELDSNTYTPKQIYTLSGSFELTSGTNQKTLTNTGNGLWSGGLLIWSSNLEYYATFEYAATTINGTASIKHQHKFEQAGSINITLSVNNSGQLVINATVPKDCNISFKLIKWF